VCNPNCSKNGKWYWGQVFSPRINRDGGNFLVKQLIWADYKEKGEDTCSREKKPLGHWVGLRLHWGKSVERAELMGRKKPKEGDLENNKKGGKGLEKGVKSLKE